jgi:hypothetical protein
MLVCFHIQLAGFGPRGDLVQIFLRSAERGVELRVGRIVPLSRELAVQVLER